MRTVGAAIPPPSGQILIDLPKPGVLGILRDNMIPLMLTLKLPDVRLDTDQFPAARFGRAEANLEYLPLDTALAITILKTIHCILRLPSFMTECDAEVDIPRRRLPGGLSRTNKAHLNN